MECCFTGPHLPCCHGHCASVPLQISLSTTLFYRSGSVGFPTVWRYLKESLHGSAVEDKAVITSINKWVIEQYHVFVCVGVKHCSRDGKSVLISERIVFKTNSFKGSWFLIICVGWWPDQCWNEWKLLWRPRQLEWCCCDMLITELIDGRVGTRSTASWRDPANVSCNQGSSVDHWRSVVNYGVDTCATTCWWRLA